MVAVVGPAAFAKETSAGRGVDENRTDAGQQRMSVVVNLDLDQKG